VSAFKDQLQRDIGAVFLNTDEHAELVRVVYDEFDAEISVVLDEMMQQDRPVVRTGDSDHAEGIYLATTTMYAAYSDLGFVPKNGKRITIGGTTYRVVTSTNEAGVVVCGLEAYGE
jgi:hypothetical protein